jgi:transcriptional regulator with XRE-family HTH domain
MKKILSAHDEKALYQLTPKEGEKFLPYEWIKILRIYLQMTQSELAYRAKMTQARVALIEAGRVDPQWSTLQRLFDAMDCDLSVVPRPRKPVEEVLRGRARAVALQRLKSSAGSMAMEGQGPEAEDFQALLEKKTDEILSDGREKLWRDKPHE